MNDAFSILCVQEEKHALRRAMRRQLAALDPAMRRESSRLVLARLLALPAWRQARCVALFAPTASEPDLDLLWGDGHLSGKTCVYPVVAEKHLQLYPVESLAELAPVPPWNLREPVPSAAARKPFAEVDLVLVPGLAFDREGGRLGRGGGYYDRLLAGRAGGKPVLVGVGFAFQMTDHLPLADHDVRLDGVVVA